MDSTFVILITLISCAFFSGMEMAFLTSNKLKIELESKQGVVSARIFSMFINQPSKFISTTLLGNCIAIVIYGLYSEALLEPFIEHYTESKVAIILLKTLLSTLFILIIAEYIPKALFSINPNGALSLFAIPFIIVYVALFPFVWITMNLSELILKLFGQSNLHNHGAKFSRVDLDNYMKSFSADYEDKEKVDHEIQIFQNALDFSSVKIRECMIPRPEMIAMDLDESIEDLKKKFIETKLSKIIIYRDSIDNVIGYAHAHELFSRPVSIKSILLPVSVFPESMPAQEVMDNLIRERRSVGIIIDEYGGTAGMITMEDVMEEIFGEIEDEHDKEELTEQKISESEYLFSGRVEIDYINEKYGLNLPVSDDYETLGGLIFKHHESIPHKGEMIVLEDSSFKFIIISVKRRGIDTVRLLIEGKNN